MAIKDKLTAEFLEGLKEVEKLLLELQFRLDSLEEKGAAYFARYKRDKIVVEFLFGPSDWDVEMIVYTSQGKFAFKDLLEIPDIAKWVGENRYYQKDGRNVRNELLWYVELLKFSLPILNDTGNF